VQRQEGIFPGVGFSCSYVFWKKISTMPVRITTTDTQDPASFAVTLDEFNKGLTNFDNHYHLASGGEFVKDYTIQWGDLQSAVTEYLNTYPVAEENVAMCFTHCYTQQTSLYLQLLICEMQPTTITENGRQVWQILNNNHQLWYNLTPGNPDPGSTALTPGNMTPSNPGALATDEYLHSFIYVEDSEADEELLADDGGLRFVRTITFPWKNEILEMYEDNTPYTGEALIHFACCSYTEPAGDTDVTWPHGLVMYMQDDNTTYLNNDSSIVTFSYKGADFGTMCPPKCGSYVVPPAAVLVTQ
jgi:hypothetical protein